MICRSGSEDDGDDGWFADLEVEMMEVGEGLRQWQLGVETRSRDDEDDGFRNWRKCPWGLIIWCGFTYNTRNVIIINNPWLKLIDG